MSISSSAGANARGRPSGAACLGHAYGRFGGRRLALAPNDDRWRWAPNFVAKLTAGSTTWKRIFTGPAPHDTFEHNVIEIIVDGSNTAYFCLTAKARPRSSRWLRTRAARSRRA